MKRRCKLADRRNHSRRLRYERFEQRLLLTTFTVDSVLDTPDTNLGDGISADASGNSTLLAAIEEANFSTGPDRIEFNIPGAGPHTIEPLSLLPALADSVVIDAYTQLGASENTNPLSVGLNTVIQVELKGSSGQPSRGLDLRSNSTVRGLAINGFGDGIRVRGSGNTIEGNFIGPDTTGTVALGNNTGIDVDPFSTNNRIGGNSLAAANLILGNNYDGVTLDRYSGISGTVISRNSIHSNGGLFGVGIDLGNDGVTLNDPGDGDSGPNGLQNFPVLTSAVSEAGSTMIVGTLNSSPGQSFTLELFANSDAYPIGGPFYLSQGETFIGSTNVVTDGSGNANILLTVPLALSAAQFVTATATDSAGNTSEFSFAVPVTEIIQPIDVDIKPGNQQNKLNYRSQGVISVAVYTTIEFDAASVDVGTIRLAGIEADGFALHDVDDDGDLDLILHFAVQDLFDALVLDLEPGDEQSVSVGLTGKTVDDVLIQGEDTINVFFPGKGTGKK